MTTVRSQAAASRPLPDDEMALIDAYWRAANYLAVGQIYLLDNPLLREPLAPEHVKPRLLGHWGTTPGLNFVYVHMNRVIRNWGLNAIYVMGPGHGGPAPWLRDTAKDKEGNVKRFWTALAIAAVVGLALFLLAAADAGASRTLGAAFLL